MAVKKWIITPHIGCCWYGKRSKENLFNEPFQNLSYTHVHILSSTCICFHLFHCFLYQIKIKIIHHQSHIIIEVMWSLFFWKKREKFYLTKTHTLAILMGSHCHVNSVRRHRFLIALYYIVGLRLIFHSFPKPNEQIFNLNFLPSPPFSLNRDP